MSDSASGEYPRVLAFFAGGGYFFGGKLGRWYFGQGKTATGWDFDGVRIEFGGGIRHSKDVDGSVGRVGWLGLR